jgi:hypothetical protein
MSAKVVVPTNPKFLNITGKRFGRLTVTAYAGKRGQLSYWKCACDCGTNTIVFVSNLTSGHTQSCGCLQVENTIKARSKHKGYRSSEYGTWSALKSRCTNPNDKGFAYYGARGIKVCQRWMDDFANFLADMGERPSPKHQLDRIDNDKDYEPNNCRWVTRQVQLSNTRRNVFLTYDGRTMTVSAWARERGIKRTTIEARLRRGWPVDQSLEFA